jgi:hypothetical protein
MARPLRLLLLLLVLPALIAVGCAKKIDTSKAERSIKAGLESKTSDGLRIASVTCPKDVEVKKGATFTCTVKGKNHQTARVTVVQHDDKGNVTYSGDLTALVQR